MEEKVIIDLSEFNRLKIIEKDIYDAFKGKNMISLVSRFYNGNLGLTVINESELVENLNSQLKHFQETADRLWAQVNLLQKEINNKKKWWNFR